MPSTTCSSLLIPKFSNPKCRRCGHQSNARALRRLSRDLEIAQAFNASVLENAARGILVVNEDGRIRFANPAISRLLKVSVAGLEGVPLLDFLQKPHVPDWYESAIYHGYQRGAKPTGCMTPSCVRPTTSCSP